MCRAIRGIWRARLRRGRRLWRRFAWGEKSLGRSISIATNWRRLGWTIDGLWRSARQWWGGLWSGIAHSGRGVCKRAEGRRGLGRGLAVGQDALHVSGDLLGLVEDERSLWRRHDFVGRFFKKAEPAVEVSLLD